MHIAVTGGTGYVGAHIVNTLLEAGHRIRLLVEPGWSNAALSDRFSAVGEVTSIHRSFWRDGRQSRAAHVGYQRPRQ